MIMPLASAERELDGHGRVRRQLVGMLASMPMWLDPRCAAAGASPPGQGPIVKAIKEGVRAFTVGSGDGAIELLRVAHGSFLLGSPTGEEGHQTHEGPVREVTLTRAFYLGKYPITQSQYQAVIGIAAAKPAGPEVAMDQLTYGEALAFCAALTETAGVTITLPTETQWEYACRAGTTTRFWSGDKESDLAEVGWYRENSGGRAREVGKKPANLWGFHDMHGNVCEFCRDELISYRAIPATDPVGRVSATEGIMRGGAWMHPADYCRSAVRLLSSDRFGGAGLRIAIMP